MQCVVSCVCVCVLMSVNPPPDSCCGGFKRIRAGGKARLDGGGIEKEGGTVES